MFLYAILLSPVSYVITVRSFLMKLHYIVLPLLFLHSSLWAVTSLQSASVYSVTEGVAFNIGNSGASTLPSGQIPMAHSASTSISDQLCY